MADYNLYDEITLAFPQSTSSTEVSTDVATVPLTCDNFVMSINVTPYTTGTATITIQTYHPDLDTWLDFWAQDVAAGPDPVDLVSFWPAVTWGPAPIGTGTTPGLAAGNPVGPHPRSKIRVAVTSPGAIAGEADAELTLRIVGYPNK